MPACDHGATWPASPQGAEGSGDSFPGRPERPTRAGVGPDLDAIDLKALRQFVAVAEAGGFRRAAELHGVLQSMLSRRVRDLEDRLGASLFERRRDGVRLTNAGRRFLDDARRIFAQIERAAISVGAAGAAGEGRVGLGIASSLSGGFLHELIRSWRSQHPCVSLAIREASPGELVAAVVQRELDVVFVTGARAPRSCEIEPLWTDRAFLATSRENPLGAQEELCMNDLAGQRFIVNQGGFGPEIRDFLIKRLSDLGISPQVEAFDVGREVLFNLVGLGFGCTTASGLETGVAYPNVIYVPICDVELPFSAVWCPANDNPALRRFLSFARTQARAWPSPAAGADR